MWAQKSLQKEEWNEYMANKKECPCIESKTEPNT